MQNMTYQHLLALGLGSVLLTPVSIAYESSYERIAWQQRGNDQYYCLDITDNNWQIYPGFGPLLCGDDLYEFLPQAYVRQATNGQDLPDGFSFRWRVWSPSGYGSEGFEGRIVVGQSACQGATYQSSDQGVQWGCRQQDSYYCIDVMDETGRTIAAPAACGEGLHQFNPADLNLQSGGYQWTVWSPSAQDYPKVSAEFTGSFQVSSKITAAQRGQDLWTEHCAACHNPASNWANNPTKVRNAINDNKGGMNILSFLTDADLLDLKAYAVPTIVLENIASTDDNRNQNFDDRDNNLDNDDRDNDRDDDRNENGSDD